MAPARSSAAPVRRRGAWGASFVAVLALAMAAALGVITLVDYVFTGQELRGQILDDLRATTAAQGRAVAFAADVADAAGRPAGNDTALAVVRQAEGVEQAFLVHPAPPGPQPARSPDGLRHDQVTVPDYEPEIARQVDRDGRATVRVGVHDMLGYAPVSPGLVLVVVRDGDVVDARLAALRRKMLPVFLLGLPLGLLVCYLAGGRRLARMHRQALDASVRDGLTGLGNRRAFREALHAATLDALRTGLPVGVALLDLDRFEQLNDEQGRAHGDEVLVGVARTLAGVRGGSAAFRLGGDEFALLQLGADAEQSAAEVDLVRAQLAARWPGLTLSAGIALVDPGRPDPGDLADRADAALYAARRAGGDRVVRDEEVSSAGAEALQDRENLLRLMQGERMTTAFQPIWDIEGRQVIAFEALARPLPDTGYPSPPAMFEAADRAGLVRELDELCLRVAFRTAVGLPPDARLFVNLHPSTMADPAFDPVALAAEATAAGLGPDRVTIELTESGVVPWRELQPRLALVRSLGFGLALDDVGAGDTGLQVLRYVDVDYVKVDRSIVTDAVSDRQARAVLSAVLSYAAETDCYVIAEGIETGEILDFVRSLRLRLHHAHVHGAQGYLLGRPGPGFDVPGGTALGQEAPVPAQRGTS